MFSPQLISSELPPRLAREIETFHSDEHATLVGWSGFVIACWHVETTSSTVRRLQELIGRVGEAQPSGIGLMQVVAPAARPPASEVRAALTEMLRSSGPWVRCSSVVVAGEGFRVAAARAVIATLGQVARPTFLHRVFSSVAQASTWHRSLLPEEVRFSEHDLTRVAESLLSRR